MFCNRSFVSLRLLVICITATFTTTHAFAAIPTLTTQRIVTGLDSPLYVTAPPGDHDRLFIVERGTGTTAAIKIFHKDTQTVTTFMTLSSITTNSERGLLGLAFHPDYANNGFFYINYTNSAGNTVIRRYTTSTTDPDLADTSTARNILTYSQPFANHNGGWIGFGPNGYLYIASGDGGSANDPGNRAQDTTDMLLGKMLRIDVNGDDFPADSNRNYSIPATNPFVGVTGDDEIWAYGLRNPWRSSFDRLTGDLWIADVGQNAREEVNFQSASSTGGENYGWRCMEGNISTGLSGCTPFDPSLTMPIHWYNHGSNPNSITGGYVYRGSAIPELQGTYFFADYLSDIWSFRYDGVTKSEFTVRTSQLTPDVGSIDVLVSFGEDAAGELYLVDFDGDIFKLIAVQQPQPQPQPEPAPTPTGGIPEPATAALLLLAMTSLARQRRT